MPDFISILMLTHNAPDYVATTIRTVAEMTKDTAYELIVVDNASDGPTRDLVQQFAQDGLIHHLDLLDRNSLFAEGNNIAARHASPRATHYLLLNSDVKVNSPDWLSHLIAVHRRGITAYGFVQSPARVDGYCLLIDADLYTRHKLDEGHQWWWSVTKLQSKVLADGFPVRGYAEHEAYIHHYGGKSGDAFKAAKGMNVTRAEVEGWFGAARPQQIDAPRGAAYLAALLSGKTGPVGRALRKIRRVLRSR